MIKQLSQFSLLNARSQLHEFSTPMKLIEPFHLTLWSSICSLGYAKFLEYNSFAITINIYKGKGEREREVVCGQVW